MFDPPCHDEIAFLVWAAFIEPSLRTVNRIIELSVVKPKALIHEAVGVLDEDHAWITRIAQIEYLQIHSGPIADFHVSKLNSLVPQTTKLATRLVKIAIIDSSACETYPKKREDDKRPS
jgi:hypothetical protein